MKKSIIYYTDNNLNYALAKKCRRVLVQSAGDIPIIAVSQKPITSPENFGKNIVVGRIGRSMLNMYLQILEGLKNTDADIVFLCEHDVLYSPEHFKSDIGPFGFCYNTNLYFLDWKDKSERKGLYSPASKNRPALSQLVCYRDILIDNIEKRIELLRSGCKIKRGISGACEPGIRDTASFVKIGEDEYSENTCGFQSDFGYLFFENTIPNIDIRNGQNLTGSRRVKESQCVKSLPYWGEFKI